MQPGSGLFIQRRLQSLAALLDIQVVSPFALVQYGNPTGRRVRIGKAKWPPLIRRDRDIEVTHPRWFYPPFGGSLTAVWLFFQLLYPLICLRRKFPFDVIDAHFGHPEGVTGALLSWALGVPFTITLRGNEPKHGRSGLGRYCMSRALRNAGRVFAVSERLRQFAIGLGTDPAKVRTIPNGIDTAVFYPRDRASCRRKYGITPNRFLIVSAGALVERKGHHRAIQAVKSMSRNGTPATLLIAGGPGPEGNYETTLRQAVSDLNLQDSIHFLGAVTPETMAEVMSAADLLCLSSTNEGWPNVVHEALACGTPVVATDVGAVPDMLVDGRYGFIVPVNDQIALENALQAAQQIDWDRSAISNWGRSRSWHQVASEVLEELRIVAEEERMKRLGI
jgi:glycosyltransferase involved in cell wall biosynthesis